MLAPALLGKKAKRFDLIIFVLTVFVTCRSRASWSLSYFEAQALEHLIVHCFCSGGITELKNVHMRDTVYLANDNGVLRNTFRCSIGGYVATTFVAFCYLEDLLCRQANFMHSILSPPFSILPGSMDGVHIRKPIAFWFTHAHNALAAGLEAVVWIVISPFIPLWIADCRIVELRNSSCKCTLHLHTTRTLTHHHHTRTPRTYCNTNINTNTSTLPPTTLTPTQENTNMHTHTTMKHVSAAAVAVAALL